MLPDVDRRAAAAAGLLKVTVAIIHVYDPVDESRPGCWRPELPAFAVSIRCATTVLQFLSQQLKRDRRPESQFRK